MYTDYDAVDAASEQKVVSDIDAEDFKDLYDQNKHQLYVISKNIQLFAILSLMPIIFYTVFLIMAAYELEFSLVLAAAFTACCSFYLIIRDMALLAIRILLHQMFEVGKIGGVVTGQLNDKDAALTHADIVSAIAARLRLRTATLNRAVLLGLGGALAWRLPLLAAPLIFSIAV